MQYFENKLRLRKKGKTLQKFQSFLLKKDYKTFYGGLRCGVGVMVLNVWRLSSYFVVSWYLLQLFECKRCED